MIVKRDLLLVSFQDMILGVGVKTDGDVYFGML